MRVGWRKKRLADVCTLQRGFDLPTSDRKPGNNPLVSSSGIAAYIDQAKVRGPGVVTGRSGSIGNVFFVENDFWPLNTALYVKEFFGNDERFVSLLLQNLDLARFASGTGVPTLNRNHVSDELVCVPDSIEEQRRIVAVLDEAFAAIATATANAEKSLAKARAAFDAWLEQTIVAADINGWQRHRLGQLTTKIGSGATPRGGRDSYLAEGTPLVRSLNVHDRRFKPKQLAYIDEAQAKQLANVFLQRDDVLLNITGASVARCCILPAHLVGGRVNQHVSIIRAKQDLLRPKFLELLLTTATYKERLLGVGDQGGSTRQAITKSDIQDFEIVIPSLRMQKIIEERAGFLEIEMLKLVQIYSQKKASLEALKQSFLHCAFKGELTQTSFPETNDNWKAPAFTAQVIALAYRRHLALGTEVTFGRVKAQKALHLCESVGGIDLGRNPVKDAAGPNDFQHMLAAEDWAKANQFFEFTPRPTGNGYTFRKLPRFSAVVAEGAEALKPVQDRLERAIGLLVPMNSEQAELLATVHAAWNNLLLDGLEANDAAIIREARENWHTAKQKFSDEKFRKAIATIRAKGIEPDGSAKRVGGQEALLF